MDDGVLVALRGVTRAFGRRVVLDRVDLEVPAGQLLGVVGPNGGGKSTLLLLMSGLLLPTSGDARVCGIPASALSRTRAGLVGLVTARPGLYPLLTGRENLHHFAGLFGLSPRAIDARAEPLLAALQLSTGYDERVAGWSTGMQQKLSLVRALLLSPRLLLLDEPSANLDPVVSRALYAEVRRQADTGVACVLVSHDLAAVEAICDRAVLVDGGVRAEVPLVRRQLPAAGPLHEAWRRVVGR
jgi:ABC-2 type transport system ATP-binding protein